MHCKKQLLDLLVITKNQTTNNSQQNLWIDKKLAVIIKNALFHLRLDFSHGKFISEELATR